MLYFSFTSNLPLCITIHNSIHIHVTYYTLNTHLSKFTFWIHIIYTHTTKLSLNPFWKSECQVSPYDGTGCFFNISIDPFTQLSFWKLTLRAFDRNLQSWSLFLICQSLSSIIFILPVRVKSTSFLFFKIFWLPHVPKHHVKSCWSQLSFKYEADSTENAAQNSTQMIFCFLAGGTE